MKNFNNNSDGPHIKIFIYEASLSPKKKKVQDSFLKAKEQ
jgi:hypothetical protein